MKISKSQLRGLVEECVFEILRSAQSLSEGIEGTTNNISSNQLEMDSDLISQTSAHKCKKFLTKILKRPYSQTNYGFNIVRDIIINSDRIYVGEEAGDEAGDEDIIGMFCIDDFFPMMPHISELVFDIEDTDVGEYQEYNHPINLNVCIWRDGTIEISCEYVTYKMFDNYLYDLDNLEGYYNGTYEILLDYPKESRTKYAKLLWQARQNHKKMMAKTQDSEEEFWKKFQDRYIDEIKYEISKIER